MFSMKINEKEYIVKFGYFSLAKSNLISEVMKLQDIIDENNRKRENREKFPEYSDDETDSTKEYVILIQGVMDILPKLLLAGLQKKHEEFSVNYDSAYDVKKKEHEIMELLDDYMDDENSMDMMDLYMKLVEELFNNGFLSQKSQKLEKAMTETDATVTPTDHKVPKN